VSNSLTTVCFACFGTFYQCNYVLSTGQLYTGGFSQQFGVNIAGTNWGSLQNAERKKPISVDGNNIIP